MDTVRLKDKQQTKIVAHRGLSGIEAENTYAAFVAAGNRDYFGVETDVHVTKDKQFAIFHDDRSGRMCAADLPLEESCFADLRALSMREAGTDGFSDVQRMPSLQEYLRIMRRYDKVAVIELKNKMEETDLHSIAELCASEYALEKIIFISFCFENLLIMRKLLPAQRMQFLTGQYTDDLPAKLAEHALGVDILYTQLTAERVQKFHGLGVEVNCFTCDNAPDGAALVAMGVDMITSNILQ